MFGLIRGGRVKKINFKLIKMKMLTVMRSQHPRGPATDNPSLEPSSLQERTGVVPLFFHGSDLFQVAFNCA